MRKKYIYISLLISTGIYAIADYYCIYNFTFTLLFTIFLIFNLVNSVICFAKNSCEFSIIASIIYVFMIMHNLFVLAFNYSISSGGFHMRPAYRRHVWYIRHFMRAESSTIRHTRPAGDSMVSVPLS